MARVPNWNSSVDLFHAGNRQVCLFCTHYESVIPSKVHGAPFFGSQSVMDGWSSFADHLPVGLLRVDAEAVVTYANRSAEQLFGYPAGGLVGISLYELSYLGTVLPETDEPHAEIHPWLRPGMDGVLRSRASEEERSLRGVHRDGRVFPLEFGLQRITGSFGTASLLTVIDLSARKSVEARFLKLTLELGERTTALEDRTRELQAEVERRAEVESELERSRENFRYLFRRNPLPMYLFSPQTLHFIEVNDACVQHYGFSREEFLSMSIREIHPPAQQERLQEVLTSDPMPEQRSIRNWTQCNRAGKLMEVDLFCRSMSLSADAARLVAVVDVTARNAVEAQLRQAQKMEAIGQLTGGVAHDFNNLLTIVQGNLELLADSLQGKDELLSMTTEALSSVRRGGSLTQRLLAFARQQPLEPRVVDTAHMVMDMTGLFRRSLEENILVEPSLAPDLWTICVDASQMENALLNLALNARDAMPRGGTLRIEACNLVLAEDSGEIEAGEYVQISVSDTGTGMKREVLEHILEPFYTTKPVGRGTGLGLSMVYGFIRQSGGHLKICSEFGKGTTVKLILPREQGAVRPLESGVALSAVEPGRGAGETILLVEDDATIRMLVERLLGMMGYHVLSAANGVAALALLEDTPQARLLLTDVVLPGDLSGPMLAGEAQQRLPGLRVLFMSGYTRNALLHSHMTEESASILTKPFRKDDLARAVHRALNS